MKLGRHLSISKGINKAIRKTKKINSNSLQIFTKSPRSWKNKVFDETEIKKIKENLIKYNIKGFVVHSNYLVNLATPNDELYNKSINELKNDIKLSSQINADFFVFHPGNFVSSSKIEGIKRIIDALNNLLDIVDQKPKILIENTAGAGTEIGSTIDELAEILNTINNYDKLGLCLDLCHLFVAGYNLSKKEGIEKLIEEVDKIIGLENLKLIHLNDSKFDLGTKKDRHEHIGKGKIGLDNISYFINHEKLKDKLYIIETPPFDGIDKDIQTILNLKR